MMNEKTSKSILISVLGVAILVVAVVGISFAAFSATQTSTTASSIATGTITFSYTEPDNGISITNAMPTTDTVGKALACATAGNCFEFVVSANASGAIVIPYEISFTEVTTTLPASDVKLYLSKMVSTTDTQVVAPALASSFSATTASNFRGVASGTKLLLGGQSYTFTSLTAGTAQSTTYRLRMWMRDGATVTGTTRTYSIKVNVDSKK